ncbi:MULTISPECIES: DUF4082 domain-containing protein [Bradyrhizobium]|uniref:VCBS repeat-containing protein n=13 Tax=Bradyrhizobium TaxID=374 RepID=A0ABV4FYZ3_9BRAD|nr:MULTISPECIES: DUF4082 domain-containing protein [Bradyrhizobium]MBR1293788.1 DUF4082 domain-containing protein [Bradyrhizobium ottawaense]PDT68188.1 hypothetical protein CO683_17170 [Bradyrhizobium ottawaense]WLB49056.1 DUF4082 domain-containing protein [Bradyrhizobium ottawaense]WQN86380.1 DUF4082 domain-containing protein [Bradyrhizobium ottawaense]
MLNQKASVFHRPARPLLPEEGDFGQIDADLLGAPLWNAIRSRDAAWLWRTTSTLTRPDSLGSLLSSSSDLRAAAASSRSRAGTTHWISSSGGYWNVATNWSAGIPTAAHGAFIGAPGSYVVTTRANVDVGSLIVEAGVTIALGEDSSFVVEGNAINNGSIKVGSPGGEGVAAADFKGDVRGSGAFAISDKSALEIGGSVSGQLVNGSFYGITVSFETDVGTLVLDRSAQFHGLIGSSSPDRPLSTGNLIDLRDFAFTSTMSASVHYDLGSNISTVDFSNGVGNVTLLFSGQDTNWTFASDGQGGTLVADPVTNPIVLENQKQGTSPNIWQIDPGADSTKIQGFTTAISTNIGGTVQFKINNQTGNPNYRIDIYRLGYYGGNGARLITTVQHQAATSVVQPAPLKNASTGLVDAGNWSVTDSWSIPTDAVSGVYIANVIDGTQIFQIPFVIRNDASHSAVVFQTADQTWQAYNPWGGANLYTGNGPGINGSAYAVSYNRPITTRDGGLYGTANDMVFSAEYPAIYWLEQNGYDVSYISGIDAATSGSLLLNHQVYMDVGHDEYWTDSQFSNVQAAGRAGVNLMFLSGNEVYWQTRLAPSIDASQTANRTLISYKDTHANQLIDPTGTATGTFMDARFASTGGLSGIPSNALTGQVFQVDSDRTDIIRIPYDMTKLRFWRNTSVANTPVGQTASLVQNLLGYEWDSSPDNGFRPAGLVNVSSSTLQITGQYLLDYGNTTGNGTATHNLVEFRDPVSGALVFGAGTVFWSWGLASDHDQVVGSATPIDPNVQQATVNVLADMGVQPATLQASLVIASQSTDHTAPTSTVTNVSASSIPEGQSVTVTGSASDAGGVIGGVEVSADSGQTWHPASSRVGIANVTWSYTFSAGASGQYNIKSRAVDDSLNLETAGQGVAYTVTPSSNLTIFNPTDTPAVVTTNDAGAVELGVKFVAAESGDITGIRFYKGPQNTGTHLGDLWTTNGVLLASATFTNESASGWQQVNFATPVHVQAGVTYIASYHTNTGQYSTTDFYFDNAGHTHGALTATGSGLNGVYAYGPGPLFPNTVSIVKAQNYWVDVVFRNTSQQPQANNDSGFNVTENGVLTIPASALLANDTDPAGLSFSITGVSSPINGSVSYNAQAQTVTFTPTANFAGSAQFSYTITDTSEATGTGQVLLNVNYPVSAQSLFATNAAPSVANSGDTSSVEVGVKFSASVSGTITGLRFYKGSSNTGTHVAHLWSSTGTLLGTATFANETASGWQQVSFASPIAISAGTTYVASYHTNGNYSDTPNYFTSSVTNGQLTAPAAGNGVYAYGTGTVFPANVYKSTNYFVDVVFNGSAATNRSPTAVADTGDATEKGGVNNSTGGSLATGNVLTNDTDPDAGDTKTVTAVSFGSTSGTIGSALNGAHGSLVLNASGTFTYTVSETDPAVQVLRLANNTLTDVFNYTMRDAAGATSSTTLTVTIHGANDAPVLAIQTGNQTATVGSAFSLTLPAGTFTDVDSGDSLTYGATAANGSALPAWLTFNASTRTFSGTPSSADVGTLGVKAAVTDLGSLTASETFNIVVTTTANAPPTAVADTGDATEKGGVSNGSGGSPATGNVLTNDTDPDAGDTKAVTAVSFGSTSGTLGSALNGAHGSLVLNASGAFTYTVNETDSAIQALRLSTTTLTDVFNYTMRDAAGATSSTTLTVTIHGANDAPVLAAQTGNQTATVGSAFSLTLPAGTFTDVDSGDSLAYTATAADGSALPAWLAFNASTRTFSGTPASADVGTLGVKAAATDLGGLTASETFNIAVGTASSTVSLFSASDTPSVLSTSDTSQVNLGVRFTSSAAGTITGIKYYKSANDTGSHTGSLWSSTGTLLASATFSNETSSGWQTLTFSSPVSIAAGSTYVASFHSNGRYATTSNYFTAARTNGPLTAPASNNGVYTYGTGNLFPTSTFSATNYWVDVLFSNGSGGTNQPPIANNDSGFNATQNVPLSISGSALLANDTDPNGDALTITGVSGAVNGTASFSTQNNTVTFTSASNYTGPASFNYTISDGRGGTASASATVTVHAPSASTVSLFSSNPTPSVVTVNDPNSVELGMKFQASTTGDVMGLRFYKGPSNTGTHVADLWSSTGTLLATATFTNETASGWQQVNFATPVTITAGTTYIASYHTAGNYSDDPNLFASSVTNGPLTAPSSASSGGNGVYAYGSGSLFPTNTFNATSYAVDVLFRPQLAA